MSIADEIGAQVTALSLTGLPYAFAQMVGKPPKDVLRQFEIWGRAGKKGLPRVVRVYWEKLAPLGLSRPTTPGVPVLELALYGQMSDLEAAKNAYRAVTLAGKRADEKVKSISFKGDPDLINLHKELCEGIKTFWRQYSKTCASTREFIVAGDLSSSVICMRRDEKELLVTLDIIGEKAFALANMYGSTSVAGVHSILGTLIDPSEYVQPELETLILRSADISQQPVAAVVEHYSAPIPQVENTAIYTSFSQEDEIDAAAERFATGRIDEIPEVEFNVDYEEVEEKSSVFGIILVVLSVLVALGVLWYFLIDLYPLNITNI